VISGTKRGRKQRGEELYIVGRLIIGC